MATKKFKTETDKEIFKVTKKGKEKVILKEVSEEIPLSENHQIKENNKILRNLLIGILILGLIFLGLYLYFSSLNTFKYKGMDIERIQQGEITFYRTSFPIIQNGQKVEYNVYLRNDPRRLETQVPFEGEFNLNELIVLNSTGDLDCNGYGVISIANIMGVQSSVGGKVVKDSTANCDPEGRYTFIQLQESDETSVTQIGNSCYQVNIANCEVLKGTERVLYEMLDIINKLLKNI